MFLVADRIIQPRVDLGPRNKVYFKDINLQLKFAAKSRIRIFGKKFKSTDNKTQYKGPNSDPDLNVEKRRPWE